MVVYFEVPDVPGQYFECARYGTMSAASCAKNYDAAPAAAKTGRLQGCIGCQVGIGHVGAGQDSEVATPQKEAARYLAVCLRCRRSGRDASSRLLGRMRLVRDHTICVSCYNREREVIAGANAKGARPKKCRLMTLDAVYLRGERAVRDHMAAPVVDRIEAVLTVLRTIGGAGGAMWASPTIQRCAAGA